MGGAKVIIAKHMAWHVNKQSWELERKHAFTTTGLGKAYCCILLPQIRPEGKVLSSQIAFSAYTRRGLQMCRWRDVIAGSSTPISPNRNWFSQHQHEIASTGKQIILVGRPGVLSQSLASLPSFRFRLSVVYQKSLNVSEQNCNVYWSKVWIQLTPKLKCVIYSAAVPWREGPRGQRLRTAWRSVRKISDI